MEVALTAPPPSSVLFGSENGGPLKWRIDFPREGQVGPVDFYVLARDVAGRDAAVAVASKAWKDLAEG